jgi:hypothetical protein
MRLEEYQLLSEIIQEQWNTHMDRLSSDRFDPPTQYQSIVGHPLQFQCVGRMKLGRTSSTRVDC